MATQHKTKQYLLALVKVLVLAITFGYIFYRLRDNPNLRILEFVNSSYTKGYWQDIFYCCFF